TPKIDIDPDWEMVELGEVCKVVRGSSPRPKGDRRYYGGDIPRLMVADITRDGMFTTPSIDSLTPEGAEKSRPMKKGEVILTVSGNPGLPTILAVDACIHDGFAGFRELSPNIQPKFLYFVLLHFKEANGNLSVGAVFQNLNTDQIKRFKIPVPQLETQRQIVAQIEKEQKLVNANKQLIEIFEQKIKDRIAKIWGVAKTEEENLSLAAEPEAVYEKA
ncbi:MAG TPA: restriction endonuclease subunit S, partial [Sphingobacteriaceae bacterium]